MGGRTSQLPADTSSLAPGEPVPLWRSLAQLIRLPNQSGTLLLMLPTFWALVLASHGWPSPNLLLIFAVGSFLMRSAGVIVNDLADRSIDRQVERTRSRPLASGLLGVREALALLIVLLALAASLVLLLPRLAILLSPVALVLATIYPFSKRVVPLPQLVLGAAFGWGVIMAWAAVQNQLAASAWLLYGATICWAVGYDTIYALQDREDDARIGVKSSALLFGEKSWLAVGGFFGAKLILLGLIGWLAGLNAGFYIVLAVVGGFCLGQAWRLRESISAPEAFRMFKRQVWVGWIILAGLQLGFL